MSLIENKVPQRVEYRLASIDLYRLNPMRMMPNDRVCTRIDGCSGEFLLLGFRLPSIFAAGMDAHKKDLRLLFQPADFLQNPYSIMPGSHLRILIRSTIVKGCVTVGQEPHNHTFPFD